MLKVVLCASDEVAAQRVAKREHISQDEAFEKNASRNAEDAERAMKLYQIDIFNPQDYADIILTTDKLSPKNMAMLLKS